MSPIEAARIVQLAASVWPRIKTDKTTCEVWFLALSRTDFYDAQDAIGELARERKTIHVSDIVKRAARIRSDLLRSLPPMPEPPVELADDGAAYIAWQKTATERALFAARRARSPQLAIPA
jgi:hypothetical protein